jgi:hypothetical protein
MKRNGKVGNNTVFYHGDIFIWDDERFARQFDPPGAIIEHCLADDDRNKWADFRKLPWSSVYWSRVAQALAQESRGIVWVLMPKKSQFHVQTNHSNAPLFSRWALPSLLVTNPKIDRVMGVEYISIFQTPAEQKAMVLWNRGDYVPDHVQFVDADSLDED